MWKVRDLSLCRFQCANIVMRRLTKAVHTAIPWMTADISYAYALSQRYEMKIENWDGVWSVLWRAWKAVTLLAWRGTSRSDMASCIKDIFSCLGLRVWKASELLLEDLRPKLWTSGVRNYFWTVTLCHLLWWLQIVNVENRLRGALHSVIHFLYITRHLRKTACTCNATIAVLQNYVAMFSESI